MRVVIINGLCAGVIAAVDRLRIGDPAYWIVLVAICALIVNSMTPESTK